MKVQFVSYRILDNFKTVIVFFNDDDKNSINLTLHLMKLIKGRDKIKCRRHIQITSNKFGRSK